MTCPYFAESGATGTWAECYATPVPFEPSPMDQQHFCTGNRYQHCPLFRNADKSLPLAIRQEVARAIG